MQDRDYMTNRRRFLKAAGLSGLIGLPGVVPNRGQAPRANQTVRWRLPLRVTERAGVAWHGERISIGVVIPPWCSAGALRLRNEQTGQLLPFSAGYGGQDGNGSIRSCQLFFPLHLAPHEQTRLLLELLSDFQAQRSVVPGPLGDGPISALDLSSSVAGIRWEPDAKLGVRAIPIIKGTPAAGLEWDWCHIAIADLSAANASVGGHLPLADKEKATLYCRVATPDATVVDLQRTLVRGAYGAGYELRQIHHYDLPTGQLRDQRSYALCDLLLFVHAGRDGIPLKVDGMGFLLGSELQKEYVWKPRGDADNPEERRRGAWEEGLRLPPGDWMLTRGEGDQSQLVIPWSSYTLDGYDLSYLVGQAHTVPANSSAKRGLSIGLARNPYSVNWGRPASWGRNTYEFRCRLAWGAIDESVAERLSRAYRRPPRVEVGEPEQVRDSLALRCWPEHFTYAPRDKIRVEIEATADPGGLLMPSEAESAQVLIRHRGKLVGEPTQVRLTRAPNHGFRGEFSWTAPETARGGYILSVRLAKGERTIESAPAVVEVLRCPQDLSRAVRMATVCEIYPDRDANVLADRLVDARINVVWMRNAFHFGQYTGPVDGSWQGAEGCQIGDIDRPVRIHGGHLRQFIQACHARGITTIVYGNVRNLHESHYVAAAAAGALRPEDVDLSDRRWPVPQDQVNYRALAESHRWEQYLIEQITDGFQRLGYDGYFFDNTSYAAKQPEAEMAHHVLKTTRLVQPNQFSVENPVPPRHKLPDGWQHPRDPEIIRWPEVGCALMEQQEIDSAEGIVAYAQFYRSVDDSKTPVMYMNDPSRRSPTGHLLRLGHLLAGKATDDLCVGNSSHDGAVFFEQCPVSNTFTRTLYGGLAAHPELFEPGPLLQGVKTSGLEVATVLAYDGLAAGGCARTLIIANHNGWESPIRNVGYYWDGPKPTIRSARGVTVTVPVPPQGKVESCWLVCPEGWRQTSWNSVPDESSISVEIGTVEELAALIIRW
jgi:hypothetical protein